MSVIPGQLIASALWNGEFNNIAVNFIPAGMDSYSDTDTQMQLQTNPYPGSVTSHATSLGGEIERLRYILAAIIGNPFWYQPPSTAMLQLGGGTMAGNIAMAGFKLTGLGAGSVNGDTVRYEQVLLLVGGTMSGPIAMGANKITGLANGSGTQDAVAFGQVPVVTDWASYVPSTGGLGTLAGTNVFWQQVGNHVFVKGYVSIGLPTNSTMIFSVPSGKPINISHCGANFTIGKMTRLTAGGNITHGTGDYIDVFVDSAGVDTSNVYFSIASGSNIPVKAGGSTLFLNNESFAIWFDYAI